MKIIIRALLEMLFNEVTKYIVNTLELDDSDSILLRLFLGQSIILILFIINNF